MKAIEMTGIEYYHSKDDVRTLQSLVGRLPERPVIVNIGVAFGTSVLAMLEARPDAYIFAIDVEADIPAHENLRGWEQNVCYILGRSQNVGVNWPFLVDMVFVDGSHYHQSVVEDIQAWLPKVKPGGIIAFDDYDKPICPAVKPVVDEMMANYEAFLLVDDIIAFRVPA